jgi:hypothetical protein
MFRPGETDEPMDHPPIPLDGHRHARFSKARAVPLRLVPKRIALGGDDQRRSETTVVVRQQWRDPPVEHVG